MKLVKLVEKKKCAAVAPNGRSSCLPGSTEGCKDCLGFPKCQLVQLVGYLLARGTAAMSQKKKNAEKENSWWSSVLVQKGQVHGTAHVDWTLS